MENKNPHYACRYRSDVNWIYHDEPSAGGKNHSGMCMALSYSLLCIWCEDSESRTGSIRIRRRKRY